jgi:hypothetical protein
VTTDHTARLYALAGTILGFFLAWAGIAAHPWARSTMPPQRPSAVTQYQQRLNRDAALVARVVASRKAAKPVVRVVTLPPVTTTRTS